LKLVVEVDGGYHAGRAEADARRDRALGRAGYTVLRLDAAVVMGDLEAAVALVAGEVARLRGA
jgi:very-short-patch-repair endonuclease